MYRLFLSSKNWQVFLLMFIVLFVLKFNTYGDVFIRIDFGSIEYDPVFEVGFQLLIDVWLFLCYLCLKRFGRHFKFNVITFYVSLVSCLVSNIFFAINSRSKLLNEGNCVINIVNDNVTWILFNLFPILYAVFNIAKLLKSIELNRSVKFKDFFVEFICILILPLGIWIIQPKLNKISKGTSPIF